MIPEIEDLDWHEAELAIRAYGQARSAFCKEQERLSRSGLLSGNDNKVGIAGEYWSKRYYRDRGCRIVEIMPSNHAGYDFVCQQHGKRLNVSVKVISRESKGGKQLRLKPSNDWHELCIVLLGSDLIPYQIGIAAREQFEAAQSAGVIGPKPVVSRGWLGEKGWFKRYARREHVSFELT